MSQNDIIQYLNIEYIKNPDKWFTAIEIKNGLQSCGKCNGFEKNGYDDLYRLMIYNLIEWKGEGLFNYHKLFRAKK